MTIDATGPEVIALSFSFAVRRSADDVFSFLADPSNVPQWSAMVSRVESPPAREEVRQGTRMQGTMHVLGFELAVNAEVAEFDLEGRRAVLRTSIPNDGRIESHFSVEDLEENTSIIHFDERVVRPTWMITGGLSKLLIARTVESIASASASNIRNILESTELFRISTESRLRSIRVGGVERA